MRPLANFKRDKLTFWQTTPRLDHDLRHIFASGGLLVGEGLPMIGKLLGHTQVQTTARYAHLSNDPVKSAANRIASRIAEVSG